MGVASENTNAFQLLTYALPGLARNEMLLM
jgi:hypothetical protein